MKNSPLLLDLFMRQDTDYRKVAAIGGEVLLRADRMFDIQNITAKAACGKTGRGSSASKRLKRI
jgi:hypothetical protein